MTKPRTMRERRGWAFTLAAVVARPVLLATTRQDWVDGNKLPAEGGAVVVANHVSHVDPLTLAHFIHDHGRLPRFLAKAELFSVPGLGTVLRSTGQIPVSRETADAARAFVTAVDAVRRGRMVVVYPEGTLTRDPGLWPMVGKTGAARIALATEAPVVPVAPWGAQEVLDPYAKRPRLFPRKVVHARAGDPVALEDLRRLEPTPEVLREATERIMDAITALLEDVRDETAPKERFDPRAAGVRRIGNPSPPGSWHHRRRRNR